VQGRKGLGKGNGMRNPRVTGHESTHWSMTILPTVERLALGACCGAHCGCGSGLGLGSGGRSGARGSGARAQGAATGVNVLSKALGLRRKDCLHYAKERRREEEAELAWLLSRRLYFCTIRVVARCELLRWRWRPGACERLGVGAGAGAGAQKGAARSAQLQDVKVPAPQRRGATRGPKETEEMQHRAGVGTFQLSTLFHCFRARGNTSGQVLFQMLNIWSCQLFQQCQRSLLEQLFSGSNS
jgi:hypothetical protein